MKRRSKSSSEGQSQIATAKPMAGRRVIAASEFKARCLRILEEVAAGETVVVTKHGKQIAVVSPVRQKARSSRGAWRGFVAVTGDIIHTDWSGEFDATR